MRLPGGARRRAVKSYLEDVVARAFPILTYDEAAAAWHATERARLESRGKPAPFVDGQIAAVASTNQLVLVTLNKKDFVHFEDLEVVNWSERRLRS